MTSCEKLQTVLIALQAFQVAFLWLHDWVPLGRLNDVAAVRGQDSLPRLIVVTLVQSLPYSWLLLLSVRRYGAAYPPALTTWLWVSYSLLLVGQLRAWWVPYLFRAEPARAARYRAMFGRTHAFLPIRNGLAPNTAHVMLHVCTVATLIVLFAQGLQ